MKISNKFNLGDIVYYPAADLRMSRLIKAPVTGIVVTVLDGKETVIYQTGQSYGVSEEDMFKTAKPAKRRLIKILQEKKKEIAKDIEKTIKKVDATKTEELVLDLTGKEEIQNKDEESKTEEITTE